MKLQKFPPLYRKSVIENDCDNKFRTGSINNADSAHVQLQCKEKMAQKLSETSSRKNFHPFIMKSMSLRTTVTTEFGPEVQIIAFMRMRKKKMVKTAVSGFRSSKFLTLI